MKTLVASCFVLALVYISCEKKNETSISYEKEVTASNFEDGIAKFVNAKDFFEALDNSSKMSLDERHKFESEKEFVSQVSLISGVMSKIDKAKTEEEINNIILNNKHLIQLTPDNEITPILPLSVYSYVANKDGYFYVNNFLHKVTKDGVLISKIPRFLEINDVNDAVIMFKTTSDEIKATCSATPEGQITESNRMAKIYVSTIKTCTNDGFTFYYRDYVNWTVKGFKKVLGRWFSYNSVLYYQNMSFTVRTMVHSLYGKKGANYLNEMPVYELRSYNFPGPEESPVEDWGYTWTAPVGEVFEFSSQVTLSTPSLFQVYGQGKSRGTTGWATVECGY